MTEDLNDKELLEIIKSQTPKLIEFLREDLLNNLLQP